MWTALVVGPVLTGSILQTARCHALCLKADEGSRLGRKVDQGTSDVLRPGDQPDHRLLWAVNPRTGWAAVQGRRHGGGGIVGPVGVAAGGLAGAVGCSVGRRVFRTLFSPIGRPGTDLADGSPIWWMDPNPATTGDSNLLSANCYQKPASRVERTTRWDEPPVESNPQPRRLPTS